MLGKLGADHSDISAATKAGDARSAALLLMTEALARLDSDDTIPAIIGARLQSAIDALWISAAGDPHSVHLQ